MCESEDKSVCGDAYRARTCWMAPYASNSSWSRRLLVKARRKWACGRRRVSPSLGEARSCAVVKGTSVAENCRSCER
eukprot:6178748-Pleurochrysis_carterae.AAC.4